MPKIKWLCRVLAWLIVLASAGATLIGAGVFLYLSPNLPSVDVLRDVQLQTPLRIYTKDGDLIGEFGEMRRTPVKLNELPPLFIKAVLAAEDDSFYRHHGVDVASLARAASQLLASGHIQTGGSTITMQVAKNYFLTQERTFSRKFNEILLALQIERELGKDEILELYVNKIFLGNRAYGVEAAAQVYYGTSIGQLTLGQWAMIAGLPKAPSANNPLDTRVPDAFGEVMTLDTRVPDAFGALLDDTTLDPAMVALMLALPSEAYLAEIAEVADVAALHAARQAARVQIARALREPLWRVFRSNRLDTPYAASAEQIARRSLKNISLAYLMLLEEPDIVEACVDQFERAPNMTDTMAALGALVNSGQVEARERALAEFYTRWQHEALVVNQWFQVQATCIRPDTLDAVQRLLEHPAFDMRNPNKVRSVIGAFGSANAVNFHREDGAGYRFLADHVIELNRTNPQIAARLLPPLSKWKKYPQAAQALMLAELRRIAAEPDLSPDVYEVVAKSLAES